MITLPEKWAEAKLGELATFVMGQAPPGSASNFNGIGTPFVKAGEFGEQRPIIREWTTSPLKLARSTDVLICVVGATSGKVNLGAECAIGRSVAAVRPRDGLEQRFLYHFLKTRVLDLRRGASGSAQGVISRETLSEIDLPLPPVAEQRRIVAKLDRFFGGTDRVREELDHIPILIERYKEAILAAAFSAELTRHWRKENAIPEPYSGRVNDLISIPLRNGLSVRGSDKPPGHRALRLSALRSRTVDLADVRFLPIDQARASHYLIQEGDILISRGNGTKAFVGIAALVPKIVQATIFPDTAFRVRVCHAKALPEWLTSIWNAPQVRQQIEAAAKTTAGIWKISQRDLSQIELNIPHVDEQREIIPCVEHAFAWLTKVAGEQARASELLPRLKQAILVKAFRGELVPQDPNDEPAAALLKRIRESSQTDAGKRRRRDRDFLD